ncbi:hypothetical protein QR98_0081870 [Sarcoptes scabiei]|uniref:Uncharacterized protein n=1 Tax=Sarcoptes scabiei TaxID=52283 RepID=A0A132AF90_SARSC|nr:hypothetical protein QR98_0081870 [Sarcoptes scabiei]
MKRLSTPTARTRNGITSTMISVERTPKKHNKPIDEITDRSTIKIPVKPSIILESTCVMDKFNPISHLLMFEK